MKFKRHKYVKESLAMSFKMNIIELFEFIIINFWVILIVCIFFMFIMAFEIFPPNAGQQYKRDFN